VFGAKGYKKASIADIAERAGVAKGMISYYFGSKKNLYIYLVELGIKIVGEKLNAHFNEQITDFFDNIKMTSMIKLEAMKDFPAMLTFFTSMYNERDEDVFSEVQKYIKQGISMWDIFFTQWADGSKFKDEVDMEMISRFVKWTANGLLKELEEQNLEKFDDYLGEFFQVLDIIKMAVYKENSTG